MMRRAMIPTSLRISCSFDSSARYGAAKAIGFLSVTGTQEKIVVGLSFIAALAVSSVVAIHFVLTGFSPYDDEGYLLISLQSFLSGGPLYRGVSCAALEKICHVAALRRIRQKSAP
jgi:hypothetical protein